MQPLSQHYSFVPQIPSFQECRDSPPLTVLKSVVKEVATQRKILSFKRVMVRWGVRGGVGSDPAKSGLMGTSNHLRHARCASTLVKVVSSSVDELYLLEASALEQ